MKRKAKNLVKPVFAFCIAFSVLTFAVVGMMNAYLPDRYVVAEGGSLSITSVVPITSDVISTEGAAAAAAGVGSEYGVQLKIMGIIPLKKATVREAAVMSVVPLGKSFGVKIFSKGVLVVGLQAVDTKSGAVNPGEKSGVAAGDIIEEINDTVPQSADDVAKLIEGSSGAELELTVNRGGETLKLTVKPVLSASDNRYKIGLWVRDSSAGIGTLTFYSPEYNIVAGLGHAVCDVDTGSVFPVSEGEMVNSKIFAVVKGRAGSPGELKGRFASGSVGRILLNSETGIYAVPYAPLTETDTVEVAQKQDVVTGSAEILTTLDSGGPGRFAITIEKITYNDSSNVKNMVIRVTDRTLLEKTGGIVQGMSGSPIIQNGKLIGAVTHVLVNDPTRGYGIFAETMLETARELAEEQMKKAS